MSSKINLYSVAKDHIGSLRNDSNDRLSLLDLFVFFGVPALAAAYSIWSCFSFSEPAVVAIMTAMSVFSGLLINVLVLIYTVAQNIAKKSETRTESEVEDEKRFLREIFSNITFAIILSILAIILLTCTYFYSGGNFRIYLTGLSVFLLGCFTLTMLMALKRLYLLLKTKVD